MKIFKNNYDEYDIALAGLLLCWFIAGPIYIYDLYYSTRRYTVNHNGQTYTGYIRIENEDCRIMHGYKGIVVLPPANSSISIERIK